MMATVLNGNYCRSRFFIALVHCPQAQSECTTRERQKRSLRVSSIRAPRTSFGKRNDGVFIISCVLVSNALEPIV